MLRVRVLLIATVLGALLCGGRGSHAAPAIAIDSVGATAHFPSGITFDLSASASRPIVKADLLYAKAELETLNLASADLDPGKNVEVSLPVDFCANYVPPGIDITYRWRLTDDQGNVVESDPQVVTWQDTRFDWQQVSTDQVTVSYYTGDKAFAQQILDSAQSTIDKLQTSFDVAHTRPIRIWAYNSKSDFQGSQAPNSQEWIAGTAYPELQVILAVLPDADSQEVGRVVPHEISHQVLYQATRNPFNVPPTWLDEGLAVSNQANGNEYFQSMVETAAEKGKLFSIRSLTSEFPYDPADASLAYAESFSVVQFILQRWGNDGMAAIITQYRAIHSTDDVLLNAIGVDVDGLDQLWKESLGYQGNEGVAGYSDSSHDQNWIDRLLANASSILLVVVVAISGAAMAIRHATNRRIAKHDSGLYRTSL